MTEYIERESLLEIVKKHRGNPFGAPLIVKAIEQAPAVDVTEVKHGTWKTLEDFGEDRVYAKCSNCNEYTDDFDGAYSLDGDFEGYHYYNYCPNCGAKMGW